MILAALWLFLPAGVANMSPVLVARYFRRLHPVWERALGSHKTWEGFVVGAAAGLLMFQVQVALSPYTGQLNALDYGAASPLLGLALAGGALFGDLAKSFLKRRVGIEPGKPWIPFDQLDYVVGGLLLALPLVQLPLLAILAIVLVYGLGSVAVNQVAFLLGLRSTRL